MIAANSRSVAESLHHTFHLMSVLANFLRMQLSVASDVNICLVRLYIVLLIFYVIYLFGCYVAVRHFRLDNCYCNYVVYFSPDISSIDVHDELKLVHVMRIFLI